MANMQKSINNMNENDYESRGGAYVFIYGVY